MTSFVKSWVRGTACQRAGSPCGARGQPAAAGREPEQKGFARREKEERKRPCRPPETKRGAAERKGGLLCQPQQARGREKNGGAPGPAARRSGCRGGGEVGAPEGGGGEGRGFLLQPFLLPDAWCIVVQAFLDVDIVCCEDPRSAAPRTGLEPCRPGRRIRLRHESGQAQACDPTADPALLRSDFNRSSIGVRSEFDRSSIGV